MAIFFAYETSRPVTGTASKGAALFRQKVMEERARKIKKVDAGKKVTRKSAKSSAKYTVKKTAKDTEKGTVKKAVKETAKQWLKGW